MANIQSVVVNWVVAVVITVAMTMLVVIGLSGALSSGADPDNKREPEETLVSGSVAQKQPKEDSFDQKIQRYVTNLYSAASGLRSIPAGDLSYLAEEICSDLKAGGQGKLYLAEHVAASDATTIDLAVALNYAYATNVECALTNDDPADNFFRHFLSVLAVQGEDAAAEWAWLELNSQEHSSETQRDLELYQYLGGTSVMCRDGSSSNAGGKQGACSWHGGVAD